jgi:glycosyltransferase involved in cell wall biosynthesis
MSSPGRGYAQPVPSASDVRVSVVITNYNYAEFLGAAIDSVLAQEHPDVELIVVDDGSTDGSRDVISTYGDVLTAIEGPNLGQGHAVNTGFAASSGEVVLFLDADDRLHPTAVARIAAAFNEHPELSRVQMPLAIIDETGQPTGERLPPAGKQQLFSGDARSALLSCPDDIRWQPTSGNAFSRRALEQILPMDASQYRLCADYHLSTLAPLHGPVLAFDDVLGDYRIHGANGHIRRASLERVRDDIRRTLVTRSSLIDESRFLGLRGLPDNPITVPSVSHTALRALSYRLDRNAHPVLTDSRARLADLALRSLARRRDLSFGRRVASAAWIASILTLPRCAVRRLAIPILGKPIAT